MNQFLAKAIEFGRQLATKLLDITGWLVARMRSVQIDQRRGAILCVVLQLAILASFMPFRASELAPPMPPATEKPVAADDVSPNADTNPTGDTEPPASP